MTLNEEKTIITYSLLSHLKETRISDYSSLAELFFPIVKKAIVEYSKEYGNKNVKGKNISEINNKIKQYFGLDMPLSVLDFILSQINKEISNNNIFAYHKDRSFIINSFVFSELDEDIQKETKNIKLLRDDFELFCNTFNHSADYNRLIEFICSQKIELFSTKKINQNNFPYYIPKYLSLKFNDDNIFKIISDIYLGSLISSYLEFSIKSPVSNTELLIDTNFFISLIDLNTHEAYFTCKQLYNICLKLGYRFSILFSTIDEIKSLINSRVQDFSNKDIGLVHDEDIFGACIRRKLDKTQLERIKDNVDSYLKEYNIDIMYESRIKDIVVKAYKSSKYEEFLKIRNNQKLSALNDTIAYMYVSKKRGNNINEFSDVKCWFLNNTYHKDYYINLGYKLHERYRISANELLSILWLSNPSQIDFDIMTLAKGGLATYIAKYKQEKIPSISIVKDINNRAKSALELGSLSEKDVFSISIRMAEGQFTNSEVQDLLELSDNEFINKIISISKNDEELKLKFTEFKKQQVNENKELSKKYEDLKKELSEIKINKIRDDYVEKKILYTIQKMNKRALQYISLLIILLILWFLNYYEFELIPKIISGIIALTLFFLPLFIPIENKKTLFKCVRFIFFKNFRDKTIFKLKEGLIKEFENSNQPR